MTNESRIRGFVGDCAHHIVVQVRCVRHSLAISYISEMFVEETLVSSDLFTVIFLVIIVDDNIDLILLRILISFLHRLQFFRLFNL